MAMYASDAASAITTVQPAGRVLSWLCEGAEQLLDKRATVSPRPSQSTNAIDPAFKDDSVRPVGVRFSGPWTPGVAVKAQR